MPGSEADDRGGTVERELSALEEAVARLTRAYRELSERAEEAEASRRRLAEALEGAETGDLDAEEAASRFAEILEENRRLRERLEEGRERAERIRSRLIMMEDEL